MDAAPQTNIPEYSVSDISAAVKRTLEGAFGRVRVRGEITELKRYASGHTYLSLKDEGGKLAAVIWKGVAARGLGVEPENGVEVIATGRLTAYGDRSTYQLMIDRLDYAGAGALLARIEALRQRLLAEGVFDADRKRPIPRLPQVIGVVSSPQGAVIQDIRTTILRRFPRTILLWPVAVQGEGAAGQVAAAIRGFDAIVPGGPVPRPDVLIVARGGGSLEDLMAFNDEAVVRAAAACRIPLISAVGHETDTTLIDYAADIRAPTPTAAAELAVPVRTELRAGLHAIAARLAGALSQQTQGARLRLNRAERGLPDLPGLLGAARQRLDDRSERLGLALPGLLAAGRQRLGDRGERLAMALPALLTRRRDDLGRSGSRLPGALRQALSRLHATAMRTLARLSDAPLWAELRGARARLDGAGRHLEAVSPLAVLARGYALVTDAGGTPVTSARAVSPGASLALRFADGEVRATADGAGGARRQGTLPL